MARGGAKDARSSRWRFCLQCQRVKQDGPRHKSDSGHNVRVMTAKEKEDFAATLPDRPGDGIFTFSFGKHKGRTIEQVRGRDPSYFVWVEQNDVHKKYPALREAMTAAGLLVEGPRLQIPAPDAACPLCTPAFQCGVCAAAAGLASSSSHASQPQAVPDAASQARQQRAEQKKVAHLKYMAPHQRADFYGTTVQRSRARLTRSLVGLLRATPRQWVGDMIADGLVEDLRGTPCPACADKAPAPGKRSLEHLGGEAMLGPVVCPKRARGDEEEGPTNKITARTVHYRCGLCRSRFDVTRGNPLFQAAVGHGRVTPDIVVAILWMTVENCTHTQVMRTLDVSMQVATEYMDLARSIMAHAALQHQTEAAPATGTTQSFKRAHCFRWCDMLQTMRLATIFANSNFRVLRLIARCLTITTPGAINWALAGGARF